MKPLLLIAVAGALLQTTAGLSQETATPKRPLVISCFNAGTQMPGSGVLGVFSVPVHPGITVGTEFYYRQPGANTFFQTARLGVLHHRLSQTAVQLYTEAGYRRRIVDGLGAELRLGGGYLHSFSDVEIFRIENGSYNRQTNWGRPQAMAGAAFGLSYAWSENQAYRVFLDYQFYLQLPFVKNYVPLLPNSALHVGMAFPLFKH